MKIRYAWAAIPLAALLVWGWSQLPPAEPTLAGMMPQGALLYLEAKDFGALLNDWNSSPEKSAWLAGANYNVFSKSRLFMRLSGAQSEFAAAAGVPPDMAMLSSVAGSESALAIYDIGQLEFLYMTRLPAARATQSVFRGVLTQWSPRVADGISYSVRIDKATKRVTAYAASNGMLLLATREDLMAGALALLAKRPNASLRNEAWFDHALRAAGARGELRMACNLGQLVRSPHFRSYWIQRNVTELKQYESSVSDMVRTSGEIREQRVLVRPNGNTEGADSAAALAQLLRIAPPQAGLYRAWAAPSLEMAAGLVERKILAPRTGAAPAGKSAPADPGISGPEGSEADLETKIDEQPFTGAAAAFHSEPIRAMLAQSPLDAALTVQSTRPLPDGVFIGTESAVALLGKNAWDANSVRAAVLASVDGLWTSGKLGLDWTTKQSNNRSYFAIGGLSPVVMAIDGPVLLLATSEPLLLSMLDRLNAPAVNLESRTIVSAQFRHGAERANFARMMTLIDRAAPVQEGPPDGREPEYFSENLASLSSALARVDSESIVVRDLGNAVTQTVIYRMKK
jgi:hypothetical protein